ncbi:hypothetical protein PENSPDRAFT_615635 [Peniophora sp. CONT]|nr:hypothetical protein PENSPDRAFT_615635 [Peniophora sp. CONT]
MEEYWGQGRGLYIWGRSVHNTRIERLWYDLTRGFGQKWKNFFIQLELHDGLDPDQPAHIWLLHHLYLPSINLDARMWADSWNNHKLEHRDGEGRTTVASPAERFIFGMLEHGPRGMQRRTAPHVDNVDDVPAYGVDFDIFNDANVVAHHMDNNEHDWESGNPFDTVAPPERTQEVVCEPANCPFTAQEVAYLDQQLRLRVDVTSTSMDGRRAVWIEALTISRYIASQNPV